MYIKDDSCYPEIQFEGRCNEGRKINEDDYHNNRHKLKSTERMING